MRGSVGPSQARKPAQQTESRIASGSMCVATRPLTVGIQVLTGLDKVQMRWSKDGQTSRKHEPRVPGSVERLNCTLTVPFIDQRLMRMNYPTH
jgi:hypothetical protein